VIPYEALIYDDEGDTHVYASPKPLSFLRVPVEVERIVGNRVLLSEGPPVGTSVVTVGAIEVYGAELEIAGSH
jgi:multidrug efflux pump subunit AcrA (membrane-fusion protein)